MRAAWLAVGLLLTACSLPLSTADDPWAGGWQSDGSVLWLDEYRFTPPPPPWQLLARGDDDYLLAFYCPCPGGEGACAASMAYAEEPFGVSRELEVRAGEFFRRHLWGARVTFGPPELFATVVDGRQALVATADAVEPVRGVKVRVKAVFLHRGERVVAFFANLWRPEGAAFTAADFADFDRFVASFRFVGPSFYERL